MNPTDPRTKRDLHFLDEDGRVACNGTGGDFTLAREAHRARAGVRRCGGAVFLGGPRYAGRVGHPLGPAGP